MADKELVIKIPEETVNEIKDNVMFEGSIPSDIRCDVTSAIVNGTPLPEGHGDLFDKTEILRFLKCPEYENCDWKNCCDCNKSRCINLNNVNDLVSIIEADKVRSEGGLTREQAISELNTFKIGAKSELGEKALDMAIKALEQEPCDAVSRKAAIAVADYADYTGLAIEDVKKVTDEIVKGLKQLSPVTPQSKMGRWRDTGSGQECSECGEIQYGYDSFRKYCPNCGAKMGVDE